MDHLNYIDIISWIFLLSGGMFLLISGIGILRFPDVFTRLHAAGITDSLGMGMIIAGLMFQAGLTLVTIKLVLILLFMAFTGPVASHALAKAALHGGLKPPGISPKSNSQKNSLET